MTEKDTNPKQAFADTKVPLDLNPDTVAFMDCLGYLEGALKYGTKNFRYSGVRVSTYIAAAKRHLKKFAEGEWAAPDTTVPHLVSARACLGIILDTYIASHYAVPAPPKKIGGQFLTDDRPPSVDVGRLEADMEVIANHLRQMFADKHPVHYTIEHTHVTGE